MEDPAKQEGQKTVVAFITGLLVGGLLVWVFSSTPDTAPQTVNDTITTEVSDSENSDQDTSVVDGTDTVKVSADGDAAIEVDDQAAGDSVTLSDVTYPSTNGWVVVRDYVDGEEGKILGAARYSTTEGLTPTSVSLLRNTVKGSTYLVMFYTENGDKKFSTPSDTRVEGGSTTFEAQ